MAPLPDILISLFRRTVEFVSTESPQELAKRSILSPMGVQQLHRRADSGNQARLGSGVRDPTKLNNGIFLGLFATVGALMVLASIYFFFIAKNGGFQRIKKEDWDDYKTTVLRRKGPNGTTLSNATKSTRLGGGSIVPKWAKSEYTASTESHVDAKEMRQMEAGQAHRNNNNNRHSSRHDPELAAYKHERAAKVGGINTSLTGTSHWDGTNSNRSEVTEPRSKKDKQDAAKAEKERKRIEKEEQKKAAKDAAARAKEEKKARKENKIDNRGQDSPVRPERAHRTYPSATYSFQQGDDARTEYTQTNTATTDAYTQPSVRAVSYYDSYRPAQNLTPVREQATPVSSHHSGHRSSSHHRASRESMSNNRPARQSPSHSRQGSPRKQHRSSRPPPSDYSHGSHTASSDTGTKVYTHHIPGLSKGEVGFDDSVSQVAAQSYRNNNNSIHHARNSNNNNNGGNAPSSSGYRRGGRGRKDSLSESEM
ncbi:hypothetical protein EJ08DRAFT_659874 [Tothia fuscella]|uniref:Uncharacterized protein n=1 Tax=Tothia fuscella TaxID=1048955 RepID=A0A9P4NTV7_9PEZI|nr:hypothetical protein EJ08DRAFT_659874 [Tothia fuscella]